MPQKKVVKTRAKQRGKLGDLPAKSVKTDVAAVVKGGAILQSFKKPPK